MDNYNQEIMNMFLSQIQEENEIIKTLSDNLVEVSKSYIEKDREKDKRHMRTNIIIIILSLSTLSFFIGSYFWSSYEPAMTINGNGNSTVSGNNNTENKN